MNYDFLRAIQKNLIICVVRVGDTLVNKLVADVNVHQ